MAQPDAHAWWADVEDVKERIERRRALEAHNKTRREPGSRRTVSITGHPSRPATPLHLVSDVEDPSPARAPHRRRAPRRVSDRLGTRPDRIAGWAVLLGFTLVLITMLTAHA
jgi:hypothetical protein